MVVEAAVSLVLGFDIPAHILIRNYRRLMVLCPFVHLVLRPDIAPLTLQPAEVGSAHWVSIRALMSPHLRMFERSDVSERFFRRGNYMTRRILRAMVGQLLFTARKLVPTESTYSRSISDYAPLNAQALSHDSGPIRRLHRLWQGPEALTSYKEPPLVLWGLTYGILANFLGLLPTHDRTQMWDWPTLSPWDVRLVIWLVTYKFRASKIKALGNPVSAAGDPEEPQNGASLDGIDNSTFISSSSTKVQHKKLSSLDTVGEMLDGYFERLRNAIWIALALRLSASSLTALLLFRHYRNRRHMAHL